MMSSHEVQTFLSEFRENLELFYQCLQLAPPYDSVEKALSCLTARIRNQTTDQLHQMAYDETVKWKFFLEAMVESGLNKKHRGIITGLLSGQDLNFLPKSIRYMKEPFLTSSDHR